MANVVSDKDRVVLEAPIIELRDGNGALVGRFVNGVFQGIARPAVPDVREYGAVLDGVTDDHVALNSAIAAGGGVIPRGMTAAVADTVVGADYGCLYAAGAKLKWTGANGGTMYTQPTSGGPNIMQGLCGDWGAKVTLDANSATGMKFLDLHSSHDGNFNFIFFTGAGDQTGTMCSIRCDVTNSGGIQGSNKNTINNGFLFWTGNKSGIVLDAQGAAAASQVITLNNLGAWNFVNVGTTFLKVGPYADNNTWILTLRCSLNLDNGVALDCAANAETYAAIMQVLQPDIFAGKSGRKAVNFGAGTSRHQIGFLFNNPAEVGTTQITDGGAGSYQILGGDWQPTGAAASALNTASRNISGTGQIVTLTDGASVATDAGLLGLRGGVAKLAVLANANRTITNPTNLSKGQEFTYEILNSTGGAYSSTFTWGSAGLFKMPSFTVPGNGLRSTVTFYYDGTNLIQKGNQSTAF